VPSVLTDLNSRDTPRIDRERDELRVLIGASKHRPGELIDDDTSLIASGILDSLALFRLVVWIEEKIGRNVDPTSMDLVRECDSVRRILDFVRRAGAASAHTISTETPLKPHRRRAGVHIVEYMPEHKQAVLDLQTRLWSTDLDLNRRYFDWKYTRNPYCSDPRIYLALDQGDVVGMRGFYPSCWEIGNSSLSTNVLVADDLILREDRRDQGLVTRIMRTALDDLRQRHVEYVFNLTGGPLTVLGSIAMGWRSAGQLGPMARSTRVHRASAEFRRRLSHVRYLGRFASSKRLLTPAQRSPFARIDTAFSCMGAHDVTVRIERSARADAMADLIRRKPHDGRIRHVRDAAFLRWRFDNPLHEYRFVYAGEEQLAGYLVLKRSVASSSSHRVSIADLEAIDDRTQRALLEVAVRHGEFAELTAWSGTLDPSIVAGMQRMGFEACDNHLTVHGLPCVLVRATDDSRLVDDWRIEGLHLLDWANWDHRMIYTSAG